MPRACACGIQSGKPALQLQDLVVALRAFAPGERKAPVILCSIDPTAEGLVRMQQFLHSVGSTISPEDTEMIVNGLRTSLGMQNIRIGGVDPRTHFAQVMLECDYRMKLIGIGLETPPVTHGQLRRSSDPFEQQPQRAPAMVLHSRLP